MAIDPERLLGLAFPEVLQSYSWRDCAIYALSVGCGLDPMDEAQLCFLDETRPQALPAMASMLAHPGFWARDLDTGIEWRRLVNGEQAITWHRPLPPEGEVAARVRIVDLVDKGAGKGALVTTERTLRATATDEAIATVRQTIFCRGDGGFGGAAKPAETLAATPERTPDESVAVATGPQLALIHRLCGDLNPLHSDPEAARLAGFERPILHGTATYGVAHRALLRLLCGNDPARMAHLACRFSAPVVPGDTITVDIWHTGSGEAAFRARVEARDAIVLSHGKVVNG
ncbi:MaoC/PaaZ C-terminal domain-containing protein [Xanthobacteraceae bacterium A53D]